MAVHPKISVIVPVYNSERYIRQCLNSCFSQTYPHVEVIAVNDGSTDQSGAILDDYAKQEMRLTVKHTVNRGVTKARQSAVSHSSGQWLFFVDSDDTIPPHALEHLLAKATEDEADLVIGGFDYLDEKHSLLRHRANRIRHAAIESALTFELTCNLCGRLIRRDLADHVVWPSADIKIGEDIICGIQLLFNSRKSVVLQESVYNYIQYPNSTINSHHPAKVASMIPYLDWIDRFFSQRPEYRACADLFILHEYFAYLMYGGKWEEYPRFKAIYRRADVSKLPVKIKIAMSPFGRLAVELAQFFK